MSSTGNDREEVRFDIESCSYFKLIKARNQLESSSASIVAAATAEAAATDAAGHTANDACSRVPKVKNFPSDRHSCTKGAEQNGDRSNNYFSCMQDGLDSPNGPRPASLLPSLVVPERASSLELITDAPPHSHDAAPTILGQIMPASLEAKLLVAVPHNLGPSAGSAAVDSCRPVLLGDQS